MFFCTVSWSIWILSVPTFLCICEYVYLFIVYLKMLSVTPTVWRWMIGWQWIMNWKDFERNLSLLNLRYSPAFSLKEPRKAKNTLSQDSHFWAQNRIGNLPNMNEGMNTLLDSLQFAFWGTGVWLRAGVPFKSHLNCSPPSCYSSTFICASLSFSLTIISHAFFIFNHIVPYIAIFCRCSLFLQLTVLLIPISMSLFLNLMSKFLFLYISVCGSHLLHLRSVTNWVISLCCLSLVGILLSTSNSSILHSSMKFLRQNVRFFSPFLYRVGTHCSVQPLSLLVLSLLGEEYKVK
jgi:hypothetical protein